MTRFTSSNRARRRIAGTDWCHTEIRRIRGSTRIGAFVAPAAARGTTSSARFASLMWRAKTVQHVLGLIQMESTCYSETNRNNFLVVLVWKGFDHMNSVPHRQQCWFVLLWAPLPPWPWLTRGWIPTAHSVTTATEFYQTSVFFFSLCSNYEPTVTSPSGSPLTAIKPDVCCCHRHPFTKRSGGRRALRCPHLPAIPLSLFNSTERPFLFFLLFFLVTLHILSCCYLLLSQYYFPHRAH